MNKAVFTLILNVLLLVTLPSCAEESFKNIDSAEKKRNEDASRELVAFMSLDVMFPDASVRALAKAAGEGNITKVDQLVKEGVSVNSKGTKGATPLFWAMHNYNGFKRLLELGADPNVVFGHGDGGSVVHSAVTTKDERFLKTVLQYGGNPNLIDNQSGYTPLFSALDVGVEAIDILLKDGADINAKDRFGNTSAMVAAGTGRFEIVYESLQRGVDYQAKNKNGKTLANRVESLMGAMDPKHESAQWMGKVIEWLRIKGVIVSQKEPGLRK